MIASRTNHTANRLPNGKVLVAAGSGLSSAEVYDPASGTWSLTGSLAEGRWFLASASLGDGRVFAVGGLNSSLTASLASAEIYDPNTGTWSSAGAMRTPRASLTAAFEGADVSVVIAGGFRRDPMIPGDRHPERVEVFAVR
jgi:hypothetical protein